MKTNEGNEEYFVEFEKREDLEEYRKNWEKNLIKKINKKILKILIKANKITEKLLKNPKLPVNNIGQ